MGNQNSNPEKNTPNDWLVINTEEKKLSLNNIRILKNKTLAKIENNRPKCKDYLYEDTDDETDNSKKNENNNTEDEIEEEIGDKECNNNEENIENEECDYIDNDKDEIEDEFEEECDGEEDEFEEEEECEEEKEFVEEEKEFVEEECEKDDEDGCEEEEAEFEEEFEEVGEKNTYFTHVRKFIKNNNTLTTISSISMAFAVITSNVLIGVSVSCIFAYSMYKYKN